MKKLLYWTALLTGCNSDFGTPAQLDRENGFCGVPFGSSPALLTNATVYSVQGDETTFIQNTLRRTDGSFNLTDSLGFAIYWDYKKGKLHKVSASAVGQGIPAVLKELHRRFGPETVHNDTMYWRGETVTATAYCKSVDVDVLLLTVMQKPQSP
jgi:hypothetical protein